MGLRCSLFGHAFEEPVTERDRETRGSEVMISVREVKRCSRCGAEQVIAENTEIRHLGSEEDDQGPGHAETGMAERLEAAEESEPTAPPKADVEGDATTPEVEADEAADESTEDISKFVDKAEDPAEPPSPPDEPEDSVPADEDADVEILDDSGEDEPTGEDETEAEGEGEREGEAEDAGPSPASDADTDVSEVEGGGEVIDESAPEEPDTPQETDPESPEDDDEEEVIDDAIIIDNEAGEEERKSDLGRRELAGTGNMFDASAPEDDASSSSRESPDAELTDYYESSTDPSGTAGTSSGSSEAEDDGGEPEHAPWPDEAGSESGSDDPGFQFGPDMQQDESVPDASEGSQKSPSGITTEGPVDAPGEAEDTPPKAVVCPECGYETKGIGTSLRAGDICPDCHNGYLAERR